MYIIRRLVNITIQLVSNSVYVVFLFNKKNMCLRFPESLNYLDEYGHSQFYKKYLHLYTDHLLQANSVHWTWVPLHLH